MADGKQKSKAPGVMYVDTIRGSDKKKLNIIINLDVLGIGDGQLKLVGFQNDYKKKDTDPDFNLRVSKPAKQRTESNNAASGGGFPF